MMNKMHFPCMLLKRGGCTTDIEIITVTHNLCRYSDKTCTVYYERRDYHARDDL